MADDDWRSGWPFASLFLGLGILLPAGVTLATSDGAKHQEVAIGVLAGLIGLIAVAWALAADVGRGRGNGRH